MTTSRARPRVTLREARDAVEELISPTVRGRILAAMQSLGGPEGSLERLRRGMRSHSFATGGGSYSIARVVQSLDQRTKSEGFHVLESWDYVGHRFANEIVPVLMLDRYAVDGRSGDGESEAVLSVLLDQYLLSVLGLLAVRAWDDSDPGAVLDDVTRLLHMLGDSQHRFVNDAATLLLLAVSHYHPTEAAYDGLIARVSALDSEHRVRFARVCAPVMSGHFRWGLRFMYQRDFGRLRDDNVVDYPWLLVAVRTLVEAYCDAALSSDERSRIVEALLAGLSADPRAFTEKAPRCFKGREGDHQIVHAALTERRDALLHDLERARPLPASYAPLGFSVNFLCNAHVAMVATALADGSPHPSLDALLVGDGAGGSTGHDLALYARRLMAYASGGAAAGVPALIVYDPHDAQHAFNMTIQVLRGP